MSLSTDRKLYLGARVRILRRELGLNQTHMAAELGVSPSYLNHIERNQRPVTTQMLLRLAEVFDIDIRDFASGAHDTSSSDLREIFSDALIRDIGIPKHEIDEVAENHPNIAEAVVRLYRVLSDLRDRPNLLQSAGELRMRESSPLAWLRDVLDARNNYFPEIDTAAELLSARLGDGPEALHQGLVQLLRDSHGIEVRIESEPLLSGVVRHYDYHRRRLRMHESLPPASRLFGIAYQTAFQEFGEVIGAAIAKAAPPDNEAAVLARIALTNYAAAALTMPYARFQAAAEQSRYDLDLLVLRFGASYEQVGHRLTTLGRQGARGVPFFMLKHDVAGNVSKRFASESVPLARFGGGCPRWRIHGAFRQLGETIVDLVETQDEKRYLTFARASRHAGGGEPQMIVLGCDAKHARRIAYADPLPAASVTPIGPACHLCERVDCRERALPPITRALSLHQYQRSAAPYPFKPA